MAIVTLNETDPQHRLQSTPDQPSGVNDALSIAAGLIQMLKKRKINSQNDAMTAAANKAVAAGQSDISYEYDPATGTYKTKIAPKKDNVASQVRRFVAGQQFGVDPVTQQPIPDAQLKKPRFGYTGDLLSQLFAGLVPGAGGQSSPAAAAPAAPTAGPAKSSTPLFAIPSAQAAPAPGIAMPSPVDGQQPQFLGPEEHYNQLRAAGYSKQEARKIAGV